MTAVCDRKTMDSCLTVLNALTPLSLWIIILHIYIKGINKDVFGLLDIPPIPSYLINLSGRTV